MTLLYYDPVFQEHDTGNHPENAARLIPAIRHLNFVALDTVCVRPSWQPASVDRVCLVHSKEYVSRVKAFAEKGGGNIEQDTVVSSASYDVALNAVGAVCDAVERIVRAEDKTAFCMVRPPGHHALPESAMGFCLFNNAAIGARVAIKELGLERVMIVDWDVHHGNGTQAIFWEDPKVAYFSMHSEDFAAMTQTVIDIANKHSAGRIISILEGGYNPIALAECITCHLEELMSAK